MSYSNLSTGITYTGNGVDTLFPVNFYYIEGDPVVKAYLFDYTNPSTPIPQSFVEGVDYSVDESAYPNTQIDTTLYGAIPANYRILVQREHSGIQDTSYIQGAFPSSSIEDSIDRVSLLGHENKKRLDKFTPTRLVVLNSPQTYSASYGEYIVIASDNVTIEPPSPDLLGSLFIKVEGSRAGAIIDAGAVGSLIDGSATYTLSTSYESVSILSNGSEWYLF